jgi:hypothetical protein
MSNYSSQISIKRDSCSPVIPSIRRNSAPENPAIPSQTHGRKPKLRLGVLSLNVSVRRLVSIARVEEEAIGTNSQAGRHPVILPRLAQDATVFEEMSRANAGS